MDAVDVESLRFMEPLFANRVFLQTLNAQEILNIRNVSKTWAQWTAKNSNNDIILARSKDNSSDWYFPLFGLADVEVKARSSQLVPMLHGMWHATADGLAVSKLGKLPDLLYLPPPLTFSACICNSQVQKEVVYVVRASLGGLLLVEIVTRLMRHNYRLNLHDNRDCSMTSTDWPTLMVTNPLTKQFQVLPRYNIEHGYRWWHSSPDYFMTVDEISNSYKVLINGRLFNDEFSNLYLYDSRFMKWEVVYGFDRLIQPPLGWYVDPIPPTMVLPYFYGTYYATICTSGRLYLADIRMPTDTDSNIDPLVTAVVRLFKVDIQSGQWVLCTELPFCKSYNTSVKIEHINNVEYEHMRYVHRNLELVECRGHLYAIIPARLDEFLYQPNNQRQNMWADVDTISSKYMPLQFYIFQLTGEVGVEGHGVLRIESPARRNCKHLARRQRSFKRSTINLKRPMCRGLGNWFSCTAKGSIIWVSIDDYLLQYDIVSQECKTELIPEHVQNQEKAGVSYRANFHMKP